MGLLDDITGVLNNPTVQTLLPAALGAGAGALTSPRMSGTRGAIGNALGGAAQGLSQGVQNANRTQAVANQTALVPAEQAQLAAETQRLQSLKAQQDMTLKSETAIQAQADLITDPTEKAKYVADPASWFAGKQAEQGKPANILFLKAHGYADTTALQGLDPAQLQGMVKQVAQAHADGLKPQVLDTDKGAMMLTADPTDPAKFKMNPLGVSLTKPAATKFAPVPLEGGGIGAFDYATGKVSDTGMKGAPKGAGASKLVKGDDGFYHEVRPDGSDVKTEVKIPAPVKWDLKATGDGFFHRINAATGEDVKTDAATIPKTPPKGQTPEQRQGTIASTIKKLTPTNYEIESISPDDGVTLKYNGIIPYGHPDIKVKVPGASELSKAPHAATGEGLPEGSTLNDDGTWTLPDGTKVKPKSG